MSDRLSDDQIRTALQQRDSYGSFGDDAIDARSSDLAEEVLELRARVAALEAQVRSVDTISEARDGACLSNDGVHYSVSMPPGYCGSVGVTLTSRDGEAEIAVIIPRVDLLATLGLRGDL